MYFFNEQLVSFIRAPYFRDWLLITLAMVGLVLLSRNKLRARLRTGAAPSIGALMVLAVFLAALNMRATPTGDEPHYLIMTQSLLRDGDFDLRNNYERMDYLEYYPDAIPDPHVTLVGSYWYPVHGIGLPILAAPFFAIGGRPGVVIMLTFATAAGIRILWSVVRRVGFKPEVTTAAALAMGLTLPLVSLSGQVFPEVLAFLLVAVALGSLVSPALVRSDLIALLVSVVVLPWLHAKYIVLAAALLLSAALVHHKRGATGVLAVVTGLFAISVMGLVFLSYRWYGVPLPGAPIMMPRAPFGDDWLTPIAAHFLTEPWVGLAGLLFDQQSGLLLASPVYVLAVPGILLLWRRHRTLAVACGLVFASVYVPAGAFGVWYGGFSSPARLLTPVVPVLALCIASVLDAGGRWSWKLFAVLALPSCLHAYLMVTLPSFTRYGDPVTQHNFFIALLERLAHVDLTLLFPSFRNVGLATWLTAGVYLLIVSMIGIFLVRDRIAEHSTSA